MEPWYKFKSSDQFLAGLFPRKRDVLHRLMHEENWRSKDAVQIVSKELFKVWIDTNVYPISQQAIAQKIFKLVNKFKGIEHYLKSKRGSAFQKRVEKFTENID